MRTYTRVFCKLEANQIPFPPVPSFHPAARWCSIE